MALVATAALLHGYHRCTQRFQTAKKRGLWLDAPGGPALALAPEAALEFHDTPLLNLDDLDRRRPQRFYLPDPSFEQLADWWAEIGSLVWVIWAADAPWAWQAHGMAWLELAWRGHGMAWLYFAWAWAWHGMAWLSFAWHGMDMHGMGMPWLNCKWHGHGMAWHGMAWLSRKLWLCLAYCLCPALVGYDQKSSDLLQPECCCSTFAPPRCCSYALVGGVRLPLHAHVLAARAAVLRQMFVAQAEDGQPACSYQVCRRGSEASLPVTGSPLKQVCMHGCGPILHPACLLLRHAANCLAHVCGPILHPACPQAWMPHLPACQFVQPGQRTRAFSCCYPSPGACGPDRRVFGLRPAGSGRLLAPGVLSRPRHAHQPAPRAQVRFKGVRGAALLLHGDAASPRACCAPQAARCNAAAGLAGLRLMLQHSHLLACHAPAGMLMACWMQWRGWHTGWTPGRCCPKSRHTCRVSLVVGMCIVQSLH